MRFLIGFVFVVLMPVSAMAQVLQRADVPDWVDIVDLPAMTPDLYGAVQNGENYLLVDRQVRWVGTVRETYIRIATEAVNRNGLEAIATVSRDFDPVNDTLTMVRLDRVRDGSAVSFANEVVADLIPREARLERGIIDATITAQMSVPGVRVGDIVDAAFIWRSQESFPGYNFAGRYQMEYTVPVGFNRVVVHWPNNRDISLSNALAEASPLIEKGLETTRYEWSNRNRSPRQLDEHTPAEYTPWAAIEFSGFQSWADVSASLSKDYNTKYRVPYQWSGRVADIAQTYGTQNERAFAALRLVQDDIRYVGIDIGAGGYFARTPDTVVSDEFGDSKDKSVLLKTVLGELGLQSVVALANLNEGYGVKDRLPSVQPFNHMIVGVLIDGKTIWMDPTALFEGGDMVSAVQPDFGYVLPLIEAGSGLVKIETSERPRFAREMTETFRFTYEGAILNVETVLSGASANAERGLWAETPVDYIATDYLAYYANFYPGVRAIGMPRMSDLRDHNRITVSESYLIPRTELMKPALYSEFPFMSANNIDEFPKSLATERRDPMGVQSGLRLVHNIRIRNAPIEFNAPQNSEIGGVAFRHRFSARSWAGGNMDMSWQYETKARRVPATAVPRIIDDMRNARKLGYFSWDLRPLKQGVRPGQSGLAERDI